jgi:hypothetical protein
MLEQIKTFLISRLSQVTSFIGFITIILALVSPRDYIILAGVVLVLVDEEVMRNVSLKIKTFIETKKL